MTVISPPEAPSRSPARDPVTEKLRDAITGGTFAPNERLIEEDLARRLSTTRAAVRVALARLEQEGLVVRERNRGARVRLLSEREALEILEARVALEALVARYAAENATAHDLARLRAIMAQHKTAHADHDLLACSDINAGFHVVLGEIAGHGTAARLLALLRSQSVRFQYRALFLPGRAEHSMKEHSRLVDAIARRDPAAAEAAMTKHLGNAIVALKRSIQTGRK